MMSGSNTVIIKKINAQIADYLVEIGARIYDGSGIRVSQKPEVSFLHQIFGAIARRLPFCKSQEFFAMPAKQ
jgi:hypothetical protein